MSFGTVQDVSDIKSTENDLVNAQRIGAIGSWRWSINDDRLISCSDEYARIHGVSMDEIHEHLDHQMERVVHPEDTERVVERFSAYDQTGEDYQIEYRIIRPDGEVRHVLEIGESYVNKAVGTVEQTGVVQDITERVVAERKLSRHSGLVNLLYEIAATANEATSVEEALSTCLTRVCEFKNWPIGHVYVPDEEEDSLEFVSSGIWHQSDPERFKTFYDVTTVTPLGPGVGIIGRVLASNSPEWIEDVTKAEDFVRAKLAVGIGVRSGFAIPIRHDGRIVAITEYFTSDIEPPDEDLMNTLNHVADEIGQVFERVERETALEEALILAEHSSRVKSEFLSSMSHELRTPMNAILGFAQILNLDTDSTLSKDQKTAVRHILRGGKHLMGLINDVLELNKIETGKITLNLDSVSGRKIVEDSLSMIQSRAEELGVTLIDQTKDSSLPLLHTDSIRATQVLLNLLSNAIKYNRDGGSVTIASLVTEATKLRLMVTDTGLGIPQEQRENLFKPFERLGREAGEIEGTGIGLTITKQILELLGGNIGFHSEVNVGSTFWIELPVSDQQSESALNANNTPSEDADTTEEHLQKVLYIEDNPDNMRLMESIIDQVGDTKMISSYNAELGLVMANDEKQDLVLMDINLPGMDGLDAVKQLKNNPGTAHIPVLAITALAMQTDVEAGMNAGFVEYITKPLNVPSLIETIKDALSHSQHGRTP